jgi:putative resolvase
MNTLNIKNHKPKDFAELLGVSVKTLQNTSILVVNNESLSPKEEFVQDIISILHVFSCRLYGLRKYKNQIKEDAEIAKELQDRNKSNTRTDSNNK